MRASVGERGDWIIPTLLMLGVICGLVGVCSGIEATYCGIYVSETGQCGCFSCVWDNLAAMDPLSTRNLAAPTLMGTRYECVSWAGFAGFALFGVVASVKRRMFEGRG